MLLLLHFAPQHVCWKGSANEYKSKKRKNIYLKLTHINDILKLVCHSDRSSQWNIAWPHNNLFAHDTDIILKAKIVKTGPRYDSSRCSRVYMAFVFTSTGTSTSTTVNPFNIPLPTYRRNKVSKLCPLLLLLRAARNKSMFFFSLLLLLKISKMQITCCR